jgi:hypothetical protein
MRAYPLTALAVVGRTARVARCPSIASSARLWPPSVVCSRVHHEIQLREAMLVDMSDDTALRPEDAARLTFVLHSSTPPQPPGCDRPAELDKPARKYRTARARGVLGPTVPQGAPTNALDRPGRRHRFHGAARRF